MAEAPIGPWDASQAAGPPWTSRGSTEKGNLGIRSEVKVSGVRPAAAALGERSSDASGDLEGRKANWLPATCGNVFELFDPAAFAGTLLRAERELRLARAAGFTTMRVFLHEELFFRHGEEFLGRVEALLGLFERHGVSAMLVLFDACWRPDAPEAEEDLFLADVHNSAWVQCPTHHVLRGFGANEAWAVARLRRYVEQTVRRFALDPRVAVWDIYNEPTQRQSEHLILPRLASLKGWQGYPEHWLLDGPKLQTVLALLQQAFDWARLAEPMQPLTTAVWEFPAEGDDEDVKQFKDMLNQQLLDLSDVPSLHCYCSPDELEQRLVSLEALQRGPALVTEFMARVQNSTLINSLPVLKRRQVPAAYVWGLFNGRSNTHVAWNTWINTDFTEKDLWFHDVFHENGTAYNADELMHAWYHTTGSEQRHGKGKTRSSSQQSPESKGSSLCEALAASPLSASPCSPAASGDAEPEPLEIPFSDEEDEVTMLSNSSGLRPAPVRQARTRKTRRVTVVSSGSDGSVAHTFPVLALPVEAAQVDEVDELTAELAETEELKQRMTRLMALVDTEVNEVSFKPDGEKEHETSVAEGERNSMGEGSPEIGSETSPAESQDLEKDPSSRFEVAMDGLDVHYRRRLRQSLKEVLVRELRRAEFRPPWAPWKLRTQEDTSFSDVEGLLDEASKAHSWPDPDGEVAELLSELARGGTVDPGDYWAWDLEGLRDDVALVQLELRAKKSLASVRQGVLEQLAGLPRCAGLVRANATGSRV
ncbi:unnamed protein product [Effrenium voratum]|nr:unnamed protein product [Effrenium voratum]